MNDMSVEIILPVWNEPETTRSTIAALVAHSPEARFIFINNGSERETEQLLNEFAEHLDDRAVLLSSARNTGFVKAVNRGLAVAQASLVLMVRNGVQVGEGWLEPFMAALRDKPAAGLVIPRLEDRAGRRPDARISSLHEVDHGSFAAMLIKREVFLLAGGFDEGLDDGLWCLRDFSRRAYRQGFLTVCAPQGFVQAPLDQLFGSTIRREARLQLSQATYEERWGRSESFAFSWSPKESVSEPDEFWQLLMRGARLGHMIKVLVPSGACRKLSASCCTDQHENMTIDELPRLFAGRALQRRLKRLAGEPSPHRLFSVNEEPPLEGMLPFSNFRHQIEQTEQRLGMSVEPLAALVERYPSQRS